jgi:hypothetical protein
MGVIAWYWVDGMHVGCRTNPIAGICRNSDAIIAIDTTVNPYMIRSGLSCCAHSTIEPQLPKN